MKTPEFYALDVLPAEAIHGKRVRYQLAAGFADMFANGLLGVYEHPLRKAVYFLPFEGTDASERTYLTHQQYRAIRYGRDGILEVPL